MGDITWLPWTDSKGNHGEMRPLVVFGLTANLLEQDILRKAEAYITTDHNKAFTLKNMSYNLNRDKLPT